MLLAVRFEPGAFLNATVFLIGVAVCSTLISTRHATKLAIPDALGHT